MTPAEVEAPPPVNWLAFEMTVDAILLDYRAAVQSATLGNAAKRKARLQHELARARNQIVALARQALTGKDG